MPATAQVASTSSSPLDIPAFPVADAVRSFAAPQPQEQAKVSPHHLPSCMSFHAISRWCCRGNFSTLKNIFCGEMQNKQEQKTVQCAVQKNDKDFKKSRVCCRRTRILTSSSPLPTHIPPWQERPTSCMLELQHAAATTLAASTFLHSRMYARCRLPHITSPSSLCTSFSNSLSASSLNHHNITLSQLYYISYCNQAT